MGEGEIFGPQAGTVKQADMGDLKVHRLGSSDRGVFEKKLLNDLRALEKMLDSGQIESGQQRIGCEQEMFLVDRAGRPVPISLDLLEGLDSSFTTELGRFNLEVNLKCRSFEDNCLSLMEQDISQRLEQVRQKAAPMNADIVLTGILPTLRKSDLTLDNMTPIPRYFALNEAMTALRGKDYEFRLKGTDELIVKQDSVMLESCCTSFQLHYQVDPPDFVSSYNLAQALAGPLLAAAANSPMLFGRRLWQETRVPLFQQSIDTRHPTFSLRQRSPRVRFGERWLDGSVVDLFREDIARFRVLLGGPVEEEALEVLRHGEIPELRALQIHNGTIYRWNRGCYGVTDGKPHLRIENRVLPAGPTVLDEISNAAFFFGLMRGMGEVRPDVAKVMDFEDAELNFLAAAQMGLGARFRWFEGRTVTAPELILDELLPVAREGLELASVSELDAERYLGVFEERVRRRRNGSLWLLKSFADLKNHPRDRALSALTAGIVSRQWTGVAGHDWAPAGIEEGQVMENLGMRVEEAMSTDLVTIHPDEPVEMAANLMDWNRVRHVPVEDDSGVVVGLVSSLEVLQYFNRGMGAEEDPVTVASVMNPSPLTAAPEMPILEAAHLMGDRKSDCVVVAQQGRLVGIVTERDLMHVMTALLEREESR